MVYVLLCHIMLYHVISCHYPWPPWASSTPSGPPASSQRGDYPKYVFKHGKFISRVKDVLYVWVEVLFKHGKNDKKVWHVVCHAWYVVFSVVATGRGQPTRSKRTRNGLFPNEHETKQAFFQTKRNTNTKQAFFQTNTKRSRITKSWLVKLPKLRAQYPVSVKKHSSREEDPWGN